MKFETLLPVRLDLFDGGAAGAGTSAAAGGGEGQSGTPAAETGAGAAEGTQQAAGTETAGKAEQTAAERRRAFQELVNGEYKDLYDAETRRVQEQHARDLKRLEEQISAYQPVMDLLSQRYRVENGDLGKLTQAIENDNAYWSQAAEEAGMSVEQYKAFQKLQRENEALLRQQRSRQSEQRAQEQLQKWYGEAEQVKGLYPHFDLNAEVKNPQFLSMLKAGVPVRHAYEVVHMEEIKAGVAAMQAKATEKQVVDSIRARGTRPPENGTAAQSGFTARGGVAGLDRKGRAELARRAARGERIEF